MLRAFWNIIVDFMPLEANKSLQRRWLYTIHFVLLGIHINYTIVLMNNKVEFQRGNASYTVKENELYQTSSINKLLTPR